MSDDSPSPAITAAPDRPVPWHDPVVVLSTCWWAGRAPVAPGTFGAALGIVVSMLLSGVGDGTASRMCTEIVIPLALCLAGIPICGIAARRMGRGGDPGAIVWDEMASVPVALLAVPPGERSAMVFVAAFLLHRLFDIWKPFPCRQLERLPGGFGIMADDLGAAAWVALCLRALLAARILGA